MTGSLRNQHTRSQPERLFLSILQRFCAHYSDISYQFAIDKILEHVQRPHSDCGSGFLALTSLLRLVLKTHCLVIKSGFLNML